MNIENKNSKPLGDDEISLKEVIYKIKEWITYVFSYWKFLLIFGIIGATFGFLYAKSKKIMYTASTTFVLEDGGNSSGLGQYAGLASMAGIDLGGGGSGIFQGDNILELYKSRTMIQKTLLTQIENNGKKELLIDRYIDFNELRKRWSENPKLKNIQFPRPAIAQPLTKFDRLQDSVLGEVVKDINLNYLSVGKPDKKLSIISVNVRAPNELFAKAFNDEIVKNVNDFYIQTKTKKSQENVSILQQKTDSVRAVMNGAIYSAAVVNDITPNLNPTRQVQRVAPIQKSQFTAETNKAVLTELLKNLEMSKIASRKEAPLIQVVDQPIFPLEKEGFGKLKGLILGGLIFGFIAVVLISIRLIYKNILSDE